MAFIRNTASLALAARPLAMLLGGLAIAAFAEPAMAAEPASCLSPDPAVWPAAAKPYFLIFIDSSGSMGTPVVGGSNSCGFQHNRIGDARCAVLKTIQAFSGEVNLGLVTYPSRTSCPAGTMTCADCTQTCAPCCYTNAGCSIVYTPGDHNVCGPLITNPNINAALNSTPGFANTQTVHAGGVIAVPIVQDSFWNPPGSPSNLAALLGLVDNNCGNGEVGTGTNTPLGGMLFSIRQYFSGTYVNQFTGMAVPSPIGPAMFNGQPAERTCRSINVILITDAAEADNCDTYNAGVYPTYKQGLGVFEAGLMLSPGVTVNGQTFSIKTHVIGVPGATQVALDSIALAGGTNTSYSTANEAQLSAALANIVGSAIKPETCDNADNNCNGCTDEGSKHYCDVGQTCCAWGTPAQRTTCLNNYKATITPMNPTGNLALLPCTTIAQQSDPLNWLCFDPKETCDNSDNNCQGGADEGVLKCGNPAHCPTAEACGNAEDDDCDGAVDEGCPICVPSQEICDGCDNDCDGVADDGVAALPCGQPSPANCVGTKTCKAPVNVPVGTCVAGGGFNNCNNNPQAETCDSLDNDCDGTVDDNVPPVACEPPGAPMGLNYGANSQCMKGMLACGQATCQGFVGPSPEVCDGIDNDCDGAVDEGVLGVGQSCGINQAPCMPGTTACVSGALICQGGVGPQQEKCDGMDNDCDGSVDEGQLSDGPAMGMNGCWTVAGSCCTFKNLTWCPPPGATCNDVGALTAPCAKGALTCAGGAGWVCQGSKAPSAEVCDGIDNNCNGATDDGSIPQVGQPCGSDVGECVSGVTTCNAGAIQCMGEVTPTAELCDGLDNDCNGAIDNGVVVGTPCLPAFDAMQYPGTPTDPLQLTAPCQPGTLQCNGAGGVECIGGKGPGPEVCDKVDNDCDGLVDETGAAPDGIDATANPLPPPAANIGEACGVNAGECKEGTYACVNGLFECIGGQGTAVEECDCKDNDCNGVKDNQSQGGPPICGAGKDCVQAGPNNCQCAKPCSGGEFDCPGGQKCVVVTTSEGTPLDQKFCVADEEALCGDCSIKTVKDGNGSVVCAPAGTPPENCITPPVCVCKGQTGCHDPCFGVTCDNGLVCANFGQKAGQCVPDSCLNNPCPGCGKVCTDNGVCVDNPCTDGACPPEQTCKPSADFTKAECVPSCAGATCASDETCNDGVCVKTCAPPCAADQACDETKMPPVCVPSLCTVDSCPGGGCCDPLTGQCGACPCEGVVCPPMQVCTDGDCFQAGGTGGSSSASSGAGGAGGGPSTTTGGGAASGPRGNFGQVTGGGGLKCDMGAGAPRSLDVAIGLAVLALGAIGRRRRRSAAVKSEVVR